MGEMRDGVYLIGIYLGWQMVNGKNGQRLCIGVAAGMESYRVYLDSDGGGEVQAHQKGENVVIRARPFSSGNYGVGWGDGKIVGWPADAAA